MNDSSSNGILCFLLIFIIAVLFIIWKKLSDLQRRIEKIIGDRLSLLPQSDPPEQVPMAIPVDIDKPVAEENIEPPVVADNVFSISDGAEDVVGAGRDAAPAPAAGFWKKVWSWFCVGEEFRPADTSAEYSIVTTWLIRAGVLIFIGGAGFFLQYSFERNLFTPLGKIIILVITGLIALISGTVFSSGKYRHFMLGVAGGGSALICFSIFAGFKIFELIGETVALSLFAAATLLILASAIFSKGVLIAVIALLCASPAPFILDCHSEGTVFYLFWITVLQIAFIAISLKYRWRFLRLLTTIMYFITVAWFNNWFRTIDFYLLLPPVAVSWLVADARAIIRRNEFDLVDGVFALLDLGIFFSIVLPSATALHTLWKLPAIITFLTMLVHIVYWKISISKTAKNIFSLSVAFCAAMTVDLALSGSLKVAMLSLFALILAVCGMKFHNKVLALCSVVLFMLVPFYFTPGETGDYLTMLHHNLLEYFLFGMLLLFAAAAIKKSFTEDGQPLLPGI